MTHKNKIEFPLLGWKGDNEKYTIHITLSYFDHQTWQRACDLLRNEEAHRAGAR